MSHFNKEEFSTKLHMLYQNFLIRSIFYHIVLYLFEYSTPFISLGYLNFESKYNNSVSSNQTNTSVLFVNYIDPLFYYKKLLTCGSDGICKFSHTIINITSGGTTLIFILFYFFVNFSEIRYTSKTVTNTINFIVVHLIDIFFRIGGIFVIYFLLNKFIGSILDFLNCDQLDCLTLTLEFFISISTFSVFIFFNIKYFQISKVYLNIEKKEFPYENLFSMKFHYYMIFVKFMISFEESFQNYKTLSYLSHYIHLLKIFSLVFFVIFIISNITSKRRLYIIGNKLNTFRTFLVLSNLFFLILNSVLTDSNFFDFYNFIISLLIAFPISIFIDRLNFRSIFCDESLISQFIFFLNILRNEDGDIQLIDNSYCNFLKFHIQYCRDEICYLCHKNIRNEHGTNSGINTPLKMKFSSNYINNIQNTTNIYETQGFVTEQIIEEKILEKKYSRGYQLIKKIVAQIKYRTRVESSAGDYGKHDRILLKFLKITLKNIFRTNIFSSIYRFKRFLRRKNLIGFRETVFYYMISMCSFEASSSRQYVAAKKYEETLNHLLETTKLMEDILIKAYQGIVFGVDLYKVIHDLQVSRIICNKNLNYLDGVIFSNEINESLITMLNIVFRFIFNEFPNNHLSTYYKDYTALEKRLSDFYSKENYLVIKYNTTLDTLNLIQISGMNINLGILQSGRNFENLFHPLIRKESKELLTKKIKELDSEATVRIDLLIRNGEHCVQMMGLRARLLPSLDFEESVIIGDFLLAKCQHVLVEKINETYNNESKYFIRLLSPQIAESLHFSPYVLKLLYLKNMTIYFDDIFKISYSRKTTEVDENLNQHEEEEYIVKYDNLLKILKLKFSNSDSEEILNDLRINSLKEKSDMKQKISFKLNKKELLITDKNKNSKAAGKEYILYSFNYKVRSTKNNLKNYAEADVPSADGTFITNNLINYELSQGLGTNISSSKSTELMSANGDFEVYNVRKDLKVNVHILNKVYNNKIHNINLIITFFNLLTIIAILIFVIITTQQNSLVSNLVTWKGKLSLFQYNFYFSVMYCLNYVYINPVEINRNEYIARFEKISQAYPNMDINKVYDYMNIELKFIIDEVRSESLSIKNTIFSLKEGQKDIDLEYNLLTSGNKIQSQQFKFFDSVNLILDSVRIITENNLPVLLEIFNIYDGKLNFYTDEIFSTTDIKNNIKKLAYEILLNYKTVYENFEFYEFLLQGIYDEALSVLRNLVNVFSLIIVMLHLVLVGICLVALKIFNTSILNVNKNISDSLDKHKIELLLKKFKNVKNLIFIASDPGETLHEISTALKIKQMATKQKKENEKNLSPTSKMLQYEIKIKSIHEDLKFPIKFDNNKLLKPYMLSLVITLTFFIIFAFVFVFYTVSGLDHLFNISEYYLLNSDLSHTVVNDIIFTKTLIISNGTNYEENKPESERLNLEYIENNLNKVEGWIFDLMKMIDFSDFSSTKELFYNVDCNYVYSNFNKDLDGITSNYPELATLPKKMCEALKYTNNTHNLFINVIEEINFTNRRILHSIANSNMSYSQLREIFEKQTLWDISAYAIFVVRPMQDYLKETVVFDEYYGTASGLHRIIILFLILYVLLEILIFYLINSKFSRTILNTNEKFSEFLNCIQ
jgi:hypothetical protein